ncbi:hypothetical protein CB1_000632013 [Camelus ferus]|nr:hypothetical protein CB1_000632013 [Camelus ferus]
MKEVLASMIKLSVLSSLQIGGAVRSRQQGRSICGTARKTLEGNANGDDITKRPNDLLVPWLVSEPSVLQFSYHQLLFPQRDKFCLTTAQLSQRGSASLGVLHIPGFLCQEQDQGSGKAPTVSRN